MTARKAPFHLQKIGPAQSVINQLDTPEKCAEFYVEAQEPHAAITEVMRHVRSVLMMESRRQPLRVGNKLVISEPADYVYNLALVKELAPECVKTVEVPTSDKMARINEIAQGIYGLGIGDQPIPPAAIEEIMKLSQPESYEAVDGNKLRGLLGRGDERAAELTRRGVKLPNTYKLVIKEVPSA